MVLGMPRLQFSAQVTLQASLRMLSQRLQFIKEISGAIKVQKLGRIDCLQSVTRHNHHTAESYYIFVLQDLSQLSHSHWTSLFSIFFVNHWQQEPSYARTICRGWLCRRKIGKLKGKLAAERIQKLREEEERKKALDEARKSAQEREKALADMQKQMAAEREKMESEAAQREEEQKLQRRQHEESIRSKEQTASQEDKLRQDLLQLRKENARLQGELESRPLGVQADPSLASDLEAVRQELQEVRREKVRLEVELATSKTAEEYATIAEEATRLREECSKLKGSKLSMEMQLEQRAAQLASAEERNHKLEADCLEVQVLKSANDDLQIQLQRLEAQKQSLEQRAQAEVGLRNELRDLKLEKIHLEGELDTAKLREEAVTAKLKGSDKSSAELQQLRARAAAAEAELEQSQRQLKLLQEELDQQRGDIGSERANSLDQLRSELLSRIESRAAPPAASNRPSIMLNEDGRKSLLNQRELFEKLKQQFDEATATDKDVEPDIFFGNSDRELELEEELRRVRKEHVELNIKLTSAAAQGFFPSMFWVTRVDVFRLVTFDAFKPEFASRNGSHMPEVCRMNLRKSVKKQSIFWQVLVSWQRSMMGASR